MTQSKNTETRLVIFGATGDLAKRKLIPALFELYQGGGLENVSILAVGRKELRSEEFQGLMKTEAIINSGSIQERDTFLGKIEYLSLPIHEPTRYAPLREYLFENPAKHTAFYLSVPPELFSAAVSGLEYAGLQGENFSVAFEKPFGYDLKSARELNATIQKVFKEEQIYRIDHYVGKETVQNILAFRFANGLFEPIWNNHYIDNIQITASEGLGVENRGPYYDNSGALRDMIQNHLFQVLSLVVMEPPHSLESSAIHDEKAKVIRSLRLGSDFSSRVVFGQYEGYHAEAGVKENSRTETYAALKLEVHNWRLKGVPIYLRTGKALHEKRTRIVVEFKENSPILYNEGNILKRNRIIFEVSPHEGISVGFNVKQHGGSTAGTQNVYSEFHQPSDGPEAYERILSDLIARDHTLFTRWDMIEESWKIVDDLVLCKENCPILSKYRVGSRGPEAANALLESEGRIWFEEA